MQVWLQEFSWTEKKLPDLVAARNESQDPELLQQPMFCFETALKAFYWSGLVYDCPEVC